MNRSIIGKYVLKNINTEELQDRGYKTDTDYNKVNSSYKIMCDEWYQGYEKKRYPNRQEALKQYIMGLPSIFTFEFTYYEQRQLIKEWLKQTEKESDSLADDEISEMFYKLVTREFFIILDNKPEHTEQATNKAIFKNFEIKTSYKGTKKAEWSSDNFNNHMITVTNAETAQKITFEFWASITHPVLNCEYDILNAFYCFVSDAVSGSESFEEFCSELGYDSNSRTAEKIYRKCKKQLEKLKKIYDGDMYNLANELQEVAG